VNAVGRQAQYAKLNHCKSIAVLQKYFVVKVFSYSYLPPQFVMMLYNVVSEKDLKLRQGLKLIGLKDSVYWMTWAVTGFVIAFFSTLILMITGILLILFLELAKLTNIIMWANSLIKLSNTSFLLNSQAMHVS
jgi:hypothetical protein